MRPYEDRGPPPSFRIKLATNIMVSLYKLQDLPSAVMTRWCDQRVPSSARTSADAGMRAGGAISSAVRPPVSATPNCVKMN